MQQDRMRIEGVPPKPIAAYWDGDHIGSRDTASEIFEFLEEHKMKALRREGKYTFTYQRRYITMQQLRHMAENEKKKNC